MFLFAYFSIKFLLADLNFLLRLCQCVSVKCFNEVTTTFITMNVETLAFWDFKYFLIMSSSNSFPAI